MSYQAIIDGNFIDLLSKQDLYNLDKNKVTLVSKEYSPINEEGVTSNERKMIILFTDRHSSRTPNEYIDYYKNNQNEYGVNVIDNDDVDICNYFNYKTTPTTQNRKRTRSIDYMCDE